MCKKYISFLFIAACILVGTAFMAPSANAAYYYPYGMSYYGNSVYDSNYCNSTFSCRGSRGYAYDRGFSDGYRVGYYDGWQGGNNSTYYPRIRNSRYSSPQYYYYYQNY